MSEKPTSPTRSEAARRNGAKSRGPKTAEGKARSSMNAGKHGLAARKLLIGSENQREFNALMDEYLDEYRPVGPTERDLIEQMVAAKWREKRCWIDQGRILNSCMERLDKGDETADELRASAFAYEANLSKSLALLNRYENTHTRIFRRALEALQKIQTARKNQNEPKQKPTAHCPNSNIREDQPPIPPIPGPPPAAHKANPTTAATRPSGPFQPAAQGTKPDCRSGLLMAGQPPHSKLGPELASRRRRPADTASPVSSTSHLSVMASSNRDHRNPPADPFPFSGTANTRQPQHSIVPSALAPQQHWNRAAPAQAGQHSTRGTPSEATATRHSSLVTASSKTSPANSPGSCRIQNEPTPARHPFNVSGRNKPSLGRSGIRMASQPRHSTVPPALARVSDRANAD